MNRSRRQPRPVCLAVLACLALGVSGCQTSPSGPAPGGTRLTAAERRHQAEQTVTAAATATEPQLRLRAVEAMQYLGADAAPQVAAAVNDPHPVVRYAAWVTAGNLHLAGLAEPARAAAQNTDEPAYVRAAAAFAAAKIRDEQPAVAASGEGDLNADPNADLDAGGVADGDTNGDADETSEAAPTDIPDATAGTTPGPAASAPVDLDPIAALLWSRQAGMRANAAVLLGELGTGSARPMLRDAARQPTPRASAVAQTLLNLQISEALVKLGEEDQLNPIRLAAYSKDDEVRVLAVLMLGRLGDRTMEGAIMSFLTKDPQELRLAAAEALGDLGWPDGLVAALQGANSPLVRIRSQAALALGRSILAIPNVDTPRNQEARTVGQAALDRLLSDPEASVRVAAAAAVLEPAHRRSDQ